MFANFRAIADQAQGEPEYELVGKKYTSLPRPRPLLARSEIRTKNLGYTERVAGCASA